MRLFLLLAVVIAARPLRAQNALTVRFDDGTFGPLVRTYGPNDNPAQANPAYTVEAIGGRAVYVAPAAPAGPRLTGFLDLPAAMTPLDGDVAFAWAFPAAPELLSLGGTGTSSAIAAVYTRGAVQGGTPDWTNGDGFGGFWFGFVRNTDGARVSAIRSGQTNLTTEPFAATARVDYRMEKRGRMVELWAAYDDGAWHRVGSPVSLTIRAGGSEGVAITHVRVLDTSGGAIRVTADDFVWTNARFATAVAPEASAAFALAVGPTPSTGEVTARFTLPMAGRVRADVVDALGRRVAQLFDGPLPAGPHALVWDGRRASRGVYYLHLETSTGGFGTFLLLR